MIKGLEVGRQGAASERVWLGREWKEWKVGSWESTVWYCIVFSSLFKTHLRNRLLSPPRCREIVKEMTRVMLRQHSHPRQPQAFLAQRCLRGHISPASAQCSLQLPSQKERKASHSGPSAKKIVGFFCVFGTSFKIH